MINLQPTKIKTYPKQTLVLLLIAASALGAAILIFSFSKGTVQSGLVLASEHQDAPALEKPVVIGLPVRLEIPKIKVDAPVEYVGLTLQGAMDVPRDESNVAWFNLGQRPGATGSAVIAGHYGWKNGKQTVFDKLNRLRPGDEVRVEDENGVTNTFTVRESRRYNPDAVAPEVFGSSDGKAHLNLVTCEGTWNEALNSYSNRLVIFTEKK